jgi:hypothetical protein
LTVVRHRFNESERTETFAERVLVRCPRCAGMAVVARSQRGSDGRATVRLTCASCALVRERSSRPEGPLGFVAPIARGVVGEPMLGMTLWLQAPCCGRQLWAFNAEHLAFLQRFVSSVLRERAWRPGWDGALRPDTYYRSLPSALPTWMKIAANRQRVLVVLRLLEATLPESENGG